MTLETQSFLGLEPELYDGKTWKKWKEGPSNITLPCLWKKKGNTDSGPFKATPNRHFPVSTSHDISSAPCLFPMKVSFVSRIWTLRERVGALLHESPRRNRHWKHSSPGSKGENHDLVICKKWYYILDSITTCRVLFGKKSQSRGHTGDKHSWGVHLRPLPSSNCHGPEVELCPISPSTKASNLESSHESQTLLKIQLKKIIRNHWQNLVYPPVN